MAPSELLSSEPARRHRLIADGFAARVHGARDWSAPAPVEGWVARDVVAHLVEWLPALPQGGCDVSGPTSPSPVEDPVGAWDAHQRAVQEVLDDSAKAGTDFTNQHTGSMPLGQA